MDPSRSFTLTTASESQCSLTYCWILLLIALIKCVSIHYLLKHFYSVLVSFGMLHLYSFLSYFEKGTMDTIRLPRGSMACILKKMKDFWVEVSEFGLGTQASI